VPRELVGVAEIADRLNYSRASVSAWRTRYVDFPKPVETLAMGPVWDWEAVKSWHDARNISRRARERRERGNDA
jgi:predicted DNA-binding transcriptional regulator AlpA